MKQTIARLLLQPNKNFPVDAETLDAMQTNNALVQVLGNIVGDKSILLGCEVEAAKRAPGYVFVRTNDNPEGEVIFWEGGNVDGGMYLAQENVAVSAQGYDFPQAYTVRSLKPGVGSENYFWADFTQHLTVAELEQKCTDLQETLAKVKPTPLGVIEMWGGMLTAIPEGYMLCDGGSLLIKDYPELYAVLGMTHGGTAGATFNRPDLRGRFVVGQQDGDNDYTTIGQKGGEKQHQLTTDEMPEHVHKVRDYYWSERDQVGVNGSDYMGNGLAGSGATDWDNNYFAYKNHDTDSAGGVKSHENRPPYYVLAYIMRVK